MLTSPPLCRPIGALLVVSALAMGALAAPAGARAETSFEALVARFTQRAETDKVASSNGRIEAQSLDVAGKYAGQLTEVTAREGDLVEAGAVIARLDDRDVQARILGAKASLLQAEAAKEQAQAAVMQAESALAVAQTSYDRVVVLNREGHAAQSVLDDATNALKTAQASRAAARAQVSNGEALIAAANAALEELNVALEDLTIRAPIRGRVLYRLHEPGEVIAAGTPVATLLDLTDVYMSLYLPAETVGVLAMGDEARIVLDPAPEYVVPARITFIAPEAQFTPKSVETSEERAKLVFRVKLTIPRDLLEKFEDRVKVGVRGIGFVRTDPAADWPADLAVKLP